MRTLVPGEAKYDIVVQSLIKIREKGFADLVERTSSGAVSSHDKGVLGTSTDLRWASPWVARLAARRPQIQPGKV